MSGEQACLLVAHVAHGRAQSHRPQHKGQDGDQGHLAPLDKHTAVEEEPVREEKCQNYDGLYWIDR